MCVRLVFFLLPWDAGSILISKFWLLCTQKKVKGLQNNCSFRTSVKSPVLTRSLPKGVVLTKQNTLLLSVHHEQNEVPFFKKKYRILKSIFSAKVFSEAPPSLTYGTKYSCVVEPKLNPIKPIVKSGKL
jgi:hypothetical protein